VTTINELNDMAAEKFVALLGGIFEHSPWVAERAAAARPFSSREQLLDEMRAVIERASAEEQLALIRAHPQLGARGRSRAQLTEASAQEQRHAGLAACSDEEFARLAQLNARYVEKFSFPFILAVRGHTPGPILEALQTRLNNDAAVERRTALAQIGLIGGYRLESMVES
jgi:OHCU decarboxylase